MKYLSHSVVSRSLRGSTLSPFYRGGKLRLLEVKRLAAGKVTSESRASSAWLRQSEFSIGILNHYAHCLFRKDNSHLCHKLSGEHLTSVFWMSDKQETKRWFPVPVLLIPGPLKTIRGGVLDQSLRREESWRAFWKGHNSASSPSLSSSGLRGSKFLERPVGEPTAQPLQPESGWPQWWPSKRLECLPGY